MLACIRTAGLPPQGATRRRRANRPLSTWGRMGGANARSSGVLLHPCRGSAGCLGHKGGKSHKSLAGRGFGSQNRAGWGLSRAPNRGARRRELADSSSPGMGKGIRRIGGKGLCPGHMGANRTMLAFQRRRGRERGD